MTFRFNNEVIECSVTTAIEMCYIAVLAQKTSSDLSDTSKAKELEKAIKCEIIRIGDIIE
mgnify:CR=1 FL=1